MNTKLLLAGLLCCAHAFAQNVQRTQLANTVSSTSATQVYVYSTVIPASLSHGYIYIDSEAMQVTQSAFSPSALNNLVLLTVTRGILGTNAATHAAGAVAFFGNPGQFIAADLSGGCNSAGPQYLNVSDQMIFSCGPTGLWVGITTSLSGGGGSSYVLPIATTSVLGGIKPDGTTLMVNSSTGVASASGSGITALTGDVAASGSGSVAATLATVNSGPGSCGDATHVCQVTTNGKGLVTTQAAVAITGGGGGVTWPTTGDLVLSNSTSSPAGLAPINGDCVIGSSGAWVAGSCSGSGGTTATALQNGLLSAIPTCATNGQIYQANDQPDGQQEYNCSNFGGTFHWVQKLNIDASGPIITGGTLGIDHSIIGCLACANVNTALNTFFGIAGNGSTPPAIANGTGTMAVNSGSTNVAGSLTSSTSGTVTFTLTWASLTYAHRAVCHFVDETTAADSVKTTQSTVPTTTTLTATGTTVSGDIVSYSCAGY